MGFLGNIIQKHLTHQANKHFNNLQGGTGSGGSAAVLRGAWREEDVSAKSAGQKLFVRFVRFVV